MFVGLILVVVAVPTEDERAASHDECGNAAHYEHRQAVHLRCAGSKPIYRRSGDEHLEYKQPPAVYERGDIWRLRGNPAACCSQDVRTAGSPARPHLHPRHRGDSRRLPRAPLGNWPLTPTATRTPTSARLSARTTSRRRVRDMLVILRTCRTESGHSSGPNILASPPSGAAAGSKPSQG